MSASGTAIVRGKWGQGAGGRGRSSLHLPPRTWGVLKVTFQGRGQDGAWPGGTICETYCATN
jgi:hypothetical protein